MSTKFVMFKMANPNEDGIHEPILINPAYVRTAQQRGSDQVTLVMDHGQGGGYQTVVGDLQSVWV